MQASLLGVAVVMLLAGVVAFLHTRPESLSSICDGAESTQLTDCWESNLKRIVEQEGAPVALRQLRNLFAAESDTSVMTRCHTFAHTVGGYTYEQYKKNKELLFSSDMSVCSYGFYHGFMEYLLVTSGSYAEATAFCNRVRDESGDDLGRECFHGIGHGIVDRHVPDDWKTPEKILERSLEVCRLTADTDLNLLACADGVYNGIRNVYFFDEYGVTILPQHALGLCAISPPEFLPICYNYLSTLFYKLADNNFTAAIDMAVRYAPTSYQTVAVNAIASSEASNRNSATWSEAWAVCQSLEDSLSSACAEGYSRQLVQSGEPGAEYVSAMQFCSLSGLEESDVRSCFEGMKGELLRKFSTKVLREQCKRHAATEELICSETFTSDQSGDGGE